MVGVDASPQFIASAKSEFPVVPFAQADLSALPVASNSLGGVLAWYSIIHTPPAELRPVFAEFARVLVPGGSLLIGFFDGEPGEAFDHAVTTAYYWSADTLADQLAGHGFALVRRGARRDLGVRPHGEVVAVLKA